MTTHLTLFGDVSRLRWSPIVSRSQTLPLRVDIHAKGEGLATRWSSRSPRPLFLLLRSMKTVSLLITLPLLLEGSLNEQIFLGRDLGNSFSSQPSLFFSSSSSKRQKVRTVNRRLLSSVECRILGSKRRKTVSSRALARKRKPYVEKDSTPFILDRLRKMLR